MLKLTLDVANVNVITVFSDRSVTVTGLLLLALHSVSIVVANACRRCCIPGVYKVSQAGKYK
jgi:hypothetical protein